MIKIKHIEMRCEVTAHSQKEITLPRQAAPQGHQSITLWTEAAIGACQLYTRHGFMITEEKDR